MNISQVVCSMKALSFNEAQSMRIDIKNPSGMCVGSLVPVGRWILSHEEIIKEISKWRQQAMRMFLTQFDSTFDRTYRYLKELSIEQDDRLFFLLYDASGCFVGHIGLANINAGNVELDNLMRGVSGGDPRLVFYAELALLNWGFKQLGILTSDVRVISKNWIVISLHEEVGYVVSDKFPLKKMENDNETLHEICSIEESNVKYLCLRLVLNKLEFYKKNEWLLF